MNQMRAMDMTLAAARDRRVDLPGRVGDGVSYAHLKDMRDRARMMILEGTMSDAKMGRWLGWMQGVLCAQGILSLEDAKKINKECAE